MDGECGMEMGGLEMGGMMAWMVIWGLVGIALLVLAVVGVVRLLRGPGVDRRGAERESPEEVLRRRYASGELDEDEYLRRLSGLQN